MLLYRGSKWPIRHKLALFSEVFLMEKSYKVIVDSMADFEIGYSDPDLYIVNTPVTIGDEDCTGISPNDFYKRQREIFEQKLNIRIKTDAPKADDLMNAMLDILRSGKDAIYVATASSLTSAFTNGKAAAMVIDLKSVV